MLAKPSAAPYATIFGALFSLLAVEVAVRANWGLLPLASRGLHQKTQWLAKQPRPEVLILGDSTAHRGISAGQFAASRGLPTLNAGYTSESPIIARSLLEAVQWRPSEIVIGMFPLLLSDGWNSEPHEAAVSRFNERVALLGFGDAVLGTLWRTYENRRTLGGLPRAAIARAITGNLSGQPSREVEDPTGSLAVSLEPALSDAAAESLLDRWMAGRAPHSGVREGALSELAREWRRLGVRVTYVWMPVDSHLHKLLLERGLDDYRDASLRSIIAQYGGVVLNCQNALPDEAFYDSDHLRAGPWRDRFSEALGRAIQNGATTCPTLH